MVSRRPKSGPFFTTGRRTSLTVALLHATADAAGAPNALANQARLLVSLARHAGIRAASIATHVTGQTRRTVRSSSAFEKGEISEALAETLLARYREKKAAGQWVPDLGL